ncbi:MAG: hypothetical protein ABFD83_09295 [Armatimonadota bacterium]
MSAAETARKMGWLDLPIVTLESRRMLRRPKIFTWTLVYAAVLSIITLAGIAIFGMNNSFSRSIGQPSMAVVGRGIFITLCCIQMAMVKFVVPAYVGRAISSEREMHTFETLAITLIRSRSIVTQKMVASVIPVVGLIISAMPVMFITVVIGGVSPGEALIANFLLIFSVAYYSSACVLLSALFDNSRNAVLVAYLIVIFALPDIQPAGMYVMRRLLGMLAFLGARYGYSWWNPMALTGICVLATLLFWFLAVKKVNSLRRAKH